MCSYNKTQVSPYVPTKLAIQSFLRPEGDPISNCGQNFEKENFFFGDIVHFIDEENIVTYVDFGCGIPFYPESPTQIRQINRKRNHFPTSWDKPKCFPSNGQHYCFIDVQYSSFIFLNRHRLWDMVPAAPMSLNHTTDKYYVQTAPSTIKSTI